MDLNTTPAELGYRMPAEWALHQGTWLSWPRRETISFPGSLERVLPTFRTMVGTLVDVGLHRRPAADVARILESRDRARAGVTAPPSGLFLVGVHY